MAEDRALITGASGSEVSAHLLRAGVRTMVLMGRSLAELDSVRDRLLEIDPSSSVISIVCDMTQSADVDASFQQALEAAEYFTIIVHAAGVLGHGSIADSSVDSWQDCMSVNTASTIRLTQLAVPNIVRAPVPETGKSIVFISSFAGVVPIKNAAAYCASKGAIRAFSHAIFEDLRELSIKVSVICPGTVNTSLVNRRPGCVPSLMLQPADIADAILFVVKFPPRGCPTEIVIRPTATPYTKSA
eukprot:ANDGO_01663.mRNA.1 putative oxidoreductase SAUSA300_2422